MQLPVETYMVDTMDATNVHLPPAVPTVQCGGNAQCCPTSCQGTGWTLACNAGTCEATVIAVLVAKVDLSTDPTLARAKSVSDVTLKSIEYAICNNTLNVPVPQIEIWLAPETVTKPDPAMGAKKIGTVPMVAPMQNLNCPADLTHPDPSKFAKVMLEPDAARTFLTFTQNVKTKFNAIAVGTLVERGGAPVPTGSMTVLLSGTADVSLSL
ncbi:MAG TPA: hypothetical protein VKN99_13940 [Polyangia bacterium]|nr:hypothetical protein [Polyangia bacterium]